MSSDFIFIERLELQASIGIHPEEKLEEQRLLVSVKAYPEHPLKSPADDIEETLCYGRLADVIKNICSRRHYNILENLADILSEEIFSSMPGVLKVEIKLEKPDIIKAAQTVGIQIQRRRSDHPPRVPDKPQ